ncbi:hypothetical protein [Clostridium cellulovorans]|uniref:Uncharacterized protein n=1 Tax=Clostridium cellulovorans (strain ATCC 35296 / DSM 3052 / OCM 3 / 743B) TaxID=573061 RepID=D9SV41_CLOC7|nr:hypothetical protein [Clostridium cellulovorans]ADL53015.1 hypothetical protein Clocel_3335 [Clostridium cellulovorans 743B]
MNNIPQTNENDYIKYIINFVNQLNVMSAKKANCYKEKDIRINDIFSYLLHLVYTGKSMYMNYTIKKSPN